MPATRRRFLGTLAERKLELVSKIRRDNSASLFMLLAGCTIRGTLALTIDEVVVVTLLMKCRV